MGISINALVTDLLFAALGLCVGNLINWIAVRALAEKPESGLRCEHCGHQLKFADQIPLFSFLALMGRCRYCKQPLSWLFPLAEFGTAFMFVAFANKWSAGWWLVAMLMLGCTLIASTVTDIKARLIPHDITYPSMLCGILFSTFIRNDLFGALAGIGISYIIFDFLAHYGLKIYLLLQHHDEVDFEFVGGADAVLAAVIAAWLGWQKLLLALVVSFAVGALIAMVYTLHRVYVFGGLSKALFTGLLGAIAGCVALAVPVVLMNALVREAAGFVVIAGAFGMLLGFVCGVVLAGPREPKPFPFGPALAAGGFAAMFYQAGRI